MSQMPDDYDDEDNEVVNCYTTKEFREAVEKISDGIIKAPWADVIKEIEFDWRQMP